MNTNQAIILALSLSALSSCASYPRAASKPGFNFSSIQTVEIQAKESLSPLISRELLELGVSPLSSNKGLRGKGDAILKIALAREHPERRYVIQTAKKKISSSVSTARSGEETVNSVSFEDEPTQAPIEVQGGFPHTQTFLGAPESKIIATYAQVSLTAELIRPQNAEIVWAGSFAYEGVDLDSALEGAVRGLIRQIPIGSNR